MRLNRSCNIVERVKNVESLLKRVESSLNRFQLSLNIDSTSPSFSKMLNGVETVLNTLFNNGRTHAGSHQVAKVNMV